MLLDLGCFMPIMCYKDEVMACLIVQTILCAIAFLLYFPYLCQASPRRNKMKRNLVVVASLQVVFIEIIKIIIYLAWKVNTDLRGWVGREDLGAGIGVGPRIVNIIIWGYYSYECMRYAKLGE